MGIIGADLIDEFSLSGLLRLSVVTTRRERSHIAIRVVRNTLIKKPNNCSE